MSGSTETKLTRVEQLLSKEEFDEALQIVENVEKNEKLSPTEYLRSKILKSTLLKKKGLFLESLDLAKDAYQEAQKQGNPLQELDAILLITEDLYRLGKHDEGLESSERAEQILNKFSSDSSSEILRRQSNLLHNKGMIFWLRGDNDQALAYHQQSLTLRKKINAKKAIAASLNSIGLVHWRQSDFKQTLHYYQQSLKISEELGNKRTISVSLHNIGLVYWRKGDLDEAMKYFQRSLTMLEEIGDKRRIAIALDSIGVAYYEKGDYDQALEYSERSLVLRKEFNNKPSIANALNNIGNIHVGKGELDRALKYFDEALEIEEELGQKQDIALTLHNISNTYMYKGELNQAQDYADRSLLIRNELGNKPYIAESLNTLGIIYRKKGELDQALEYTERGLAIWREVGNELHIANFLRSIGLVHWFKGNLDQASSYLEEALTLQEQIGNDQQTSSTLYYMISVSLDRDEREEAQHYLQRLQQINNQNDNIIINQRSRIAEALVLKAILQIQAWTKAEDLLNQVIEEEVVEHELTKLALLNLCDLLLDKVELSHTQEILNKVQNHITKLFAIARQQASYWLLASTYVLQSKVQFIEIQQSWSFEKINELRSNLQEVQLLAKEQQLFIILAQAYLLLGLFYQNRMLFDEAKSELQRAREIITEKNLSKENQQVERLIHQIQASEGEYAKYMETVGQIFDQEKHHVKLAVLEQEFKDSIDIYLQTVKTSLASLEKT